MTTFKELFAGARMTPAYKKEWKRLAKRARRDRLMPKGVPRYVRCYDDQESGDRYTVVFSGNYKGRQGCDYLCMSGAPFHPQGVGQHGWNRNVIDDRGGGWTTPIGRRCHLGLRIPFKELPADCRALVRKDYERIWEL